MRRHHLIEKPMIVLLVALWLGGCATASVSTERPKRPTVPPPVATLEPSAPVAPADLEKLRSKITMAPFQGAPGRPIPPRQTYDATMEYLKTINANGQAGDPQLIVLLMSQYMNANQRPAGIEHFASVLEQHQSDMSPERHALYLSALATLRASHAVYVPMMKRVPWVKQTVAMLERARELTQNENFLVRWMSGVVYAQVPNEVFKKHATAIEHLQWCEKNIKKAPHPGWIREVYFYLGFIHFKQERDEEAQAYLTRSGYDSFQKNVYFTASYAVNAKKGFTFYPKRLKEIVPGKVFLLSGLEFTEYYFVVSDDGKELIAIDAGTRPDSAQAAYEFLKGKVPNLPPLTTVFVTHTHWDHIGGHQYFRALNPEVKFYTRGNYQEEFGQVMRLSMVYKYFFGTDFTKEFIAGFKPDVTIDGRTTIEAGGTHFELIPISGGETSDGMFIWMPGYKTLFVGDFIMPYIGAPFLEEGSLPGLFDAIDEIVRLNPEQLLHGHEPLTRMWNSPLRLRNLKKSLVWLHAETLTSIGNGMDRTAIHRRNLIPPFIDQYPDVHLIYLVMREHVIDRLYDQQRGYWQANLAGMDQLNHEEFGKLFTHYFKLTEAQIGNAVRQMLASGDYELAARALNWSMTQFPGSSVLGPLKQKVFLKLKEKYQEYDPFRFIIYSEQIGHETPQLELQGGDAG